MADGSYCASIAVGTCVTTANSEGGDMEDPDSHDNALAGEPATLLTIFLDKLAHHHHQPMYEAIVLKARQMHLAGATVLHGSLGFGASKELRAPRPLHLADDVPVTIKIVDRPEKIDAFLPILEEMLKSGTATLETVQVIRHGNPPADASA
jgi:PII-like signaling protein